MTGWWKAAKVMPTTFMEVKSFIHCALFHRAVVVVGFRKTPERCGTVGVAAETVRVATETVDVATQANDSIITGRGPF